MLTIRHIHDDTASIIEVADLADAFARPGYLWLDFHDPSPQEMDLLHSEVLGLNELVIEDMVEDRHLPKMDAYGDQLGLTVHAIALQESMVEMTTVELDMALKADLLVTYHHGHIASLEAVRRRLDEGASHNLPTAVRLLHRILDVMNDVFVPFLDLIERRLDLVEEDILTDPTDMTRREIYELQRDVIQLRRVVVPQAEVIRRLGRNPLGFITESDNAYFRDIYDHLYRMAELSESYRQLLDSAMTNYRSSLDDDLNEMLKVLTLFSAVLLPISVIAGIYGTNFRNIPELETSWAYPAMWGLFVVITVSLLLWFKSRGWIGKRAEMQARERRRALQDVLEIPVLGQVLKVPAYGTRAVVVTGKTVLGLPGAVASRFWGGSAVPEDDADDDRDDEVHGSE